MLYECLRPYDRRLSSFDVFTASKEPRSPFANLDNIIIGTIIVCYITFALIIMLVPK